MIRYTKYFSSKTDVIHVFKGMHDNFCILSTNIIDFLALQKSHVTYNKNLKKLIYSNNFLNSKSSTIKLATIEKRYK